jgi:hypothetical protein
MKKLLPLAACILLLFSCKKETETLPIIPFTDYSPLVVGKFITYNLDSLVYTNFGTVVAHRLYEVKYTVANEYLDNTGRKAFRIVRSISVPGANNFVVENTFSALNTATTYEFVENNQRVFKLVQAMADGNTWKGNSAIDVTSSVDLQYLSDWDFTYDSIGVSKRVGTFNFPNTLIVRQRDYSFGLPVIPVTASNPTLYATKDFAKEIYAKGIGMVKREFIHWEYQKTFGPSGGYIGFGVEYTIKEYN